MQVGTDTAFTTGNAGCAGSSGSPTVTTDGASTFANGDLVLLHQSRGTGVNAWEFNRISSGGGTTTLTMQENLHYTYTDSGASQAQIVKCPQYSGIIISSTKTLTDWNFDSNKGGILPLVCNGNADIIGNISGNGTNGSTVTGSTVTGTNTVGAGFHGGYGKQTSNNQSGNQGEGTAGAGTESTTTNGNGAGAGTAITAGSNPGGGGGHAASGGAGTGGDGSGQDGNGGLSTGSADLTEIAFGGGGGGGGSKDSASNTMGDGGTGAGIIIIFAKKHTVTGGITANGGTGGNSSRKAHGGGGAGGSILLVGEDLDLGSGLVTATGGAGGSGGTGGTAGAASVGRIAVNYKRAVTGTTSPSATSVQDTNLKFPDMGGAFLLNFI